MNRIKSKGRAGLTTTVTYHLMCICANSDDFELFNPQPGVINCSTTVHRWPRA